MFSATGISELEEAKHEVIYNKDLSGDSLIEAISANNPEVLIVRSTKVPADVINASTSLSLIIRAGAGVDNIDTDHASSKGIFVANCPGKNATAVAELAMGLMINVDRRISEASALLKEGKWKKGLFTKSIGLKGRTLGLIGFGNVSSRFAKRALAFEMDAIAYDVFDVKSDEVEIVATKDEVLERGDIVSLHCPATKDTKFMVNKEFLSKMKPNAVLINTARGDLINEEDLLNHLEENKDFWYATDVFQNEPSGKEADFDHPLAKHPRVYGTHHIGASTKQAENEIGQEAVRICGVFAATGQIDDMNWVNKDRSKSRQTLVIKAQKTPSVFSEIFTSIEGFGWTINSTETLA